MDTQEQAFIDERLRIKGAGQGRDLGTQLDYDLHRPLLTGAGRPRTHTIVVGADVAGDRSTETPMGTPLAGSWSPANANSVSASGVVMSGAGVLRGYSLCETSGVNPAKVRVCAGIDALAPILAVVSLNPGESVRDYFGESGIRTDRGIYFDLTTGTVEGSVWTQGTL